MDGCGQDLSQQDRQGDQLKQFAVIAFTCVLAGVVHADQNSAFQEANAFAGTKTEWMFSGIGSGAVVDKIPGYGTNPVETQFFQGGQGALSGPGVTKMQNCSNYTPWENKIANQECEAVNFLARNPDVRPQFNIGNNDQMVLGAKNARDNAATVFQSLGISGGTGSSAQCTTRTETTPAQYTTETCTTLRTIEGQQCTIGRVVNIDADSNFQCDQTVSAYETLRCRRAHSFNIGLVPGCTPGQHINRVTADPCPRCYDYLIWDFTCQSTGYLMHFWTAYHGTTTQYMDLGTRTVPGAVGTNTGRTLGPNSHEGGYCYSTYYTQVCGSTTCTITAEFYNECQGTSYSGNSTFQMPMINGLLGITRTSTCDTLESRSR